MAQNSHFVTSAVVDRSRVAETKAVLSYGCREVVRGRHSCCITIIEKVVRGQIVAIVLRL